MADFARRGEDVDVVAVGEDLAGAADDAVERPRDADIEAAHVARERRGAAGLRREVDVVALNRPVHHGKALRRRLRHRLADRLGLGIGIGAQRPELTAELERHVHGVARGDARPREVGDPGAWLARSAGTGAPASPAAEAKLVLNRFASAASYLDYSV